MPSRRRCAAARCRWCWLARCSAPLRRFTPSATRSVRISASTSTWTTRSWIEGRFDLGDIGSSAIVQLNPSFSYYFSEGDDLLNFSLNVPFEFLIAGSVVRPLAAPGIAIWHRDDADVALNLIGGVLFALDPVEPFVQLRVSIGDGSTVDLMGGVLFRL